MRPEYASTWQVWAFSAQEDIDAITDEIQKLTVRIEFLEKTISALQKVLTRVMEVQVTEKN